MKELTLRNARGVALLACSVTTETEGSAHCLKRAALGLEVIELRIEIVGAKPE